MNALRPPMSREQALAFIAEHNLHYMDIFQLVAAYAERIEGSIKGESPRVTVHIKARAKRARRAKKVKP